MPAAANAARSKKTISGEALSGIPHRPSLPAELVEGPVVEVGEVEPGRRDPVGQVDERLEPDPALDVRTLQAEQIGQVIGGELAGDLLDFRGLRDVLEGDDPFGVCRIERRDRRLVGGELLWRQADLEPEGDRRSRRSPGRTPGQHGGDDHADDESEPPIDVARGGPGHGVSGNGVVFRVEPRRIDADLRGVPLTGLGRRARAGGPSRQPPTTAANARRACARWIRSCPAARRKVMS